MADGHWCMHCPLFFDSPDAVNRYWSKNSKTTLIFSILLINFYSINKLCNENRHYEIVHTQLFHIQKKKFIKCHQSNFVFFFMEFYPSRNIQFLEKKEKNGKKLHLLIFHFQLSSWFRNPIFFLNIYHFNRQSSTHKLFSFFTTVLIFLIKSFLIVCT